MCICTCVCATGSRDELIQHCLIALRESLPNDSELTDKVRVQDHTVQPQNHIHSGYIYILKSVGVPDKLLYTFFVCVYSLLMRANTEFEMKQHYLGIARLSRLISLSFTSGVFFKVGLTSSIADGHNVIH